MNVGTDSVRQTEVSKSISALHSAIQVLSDRINTLRTRLESVSMSKPCNPRKDNTLQSPPMPSLVVEIRSAEEKIQKSYETINMILDDLEL